MTDVAQLLKRLGLEGYAEAFVENDIDAETLPHLTAEDLRELGMTSVGHRRKLLRAIEELGESAEAAANDAAAEAPAFESERRQVTVLFADLAGYTSLSNTLDAEEAHALLNRYFASVDAIVRRYGGSVDKHIGDSVMAVFGAPHAHEDDPMRAVRASADIHAAMGDIADVIAGGSGKPLSAHIGIASGQVVASGTGSDVHTEYTVTGKSVNLASRLQDLAAPGETLISDGVHAAVDHAVDCSARTDATVKGFSEPIPVWRVEKLRADHTARGTKVFAGRRKELRQFEGLVQDCRDSGSGHVVALRGEAGIGKSRLAEEFAGIAERYGFSAQRALIFDFGVGQGQDAIGKLVRGLLGIAPDADVEARKHMVGEALESGAFDREHRVFLNDLLAVPQPADLRQTYDAMDNATRTRGMREVIGRAVAQACRSAPLLLLIEDIHWADQTTLKQLAGLAAATADNPAIAIMTTRVEGDPLDQSWRASVPGISMNTLDLGPLREQDALEIAQNFSTEARSLAAECISRAGGNPLFLEHLLRHAEREGAEHVPDTIQSLVLARADKLPARDKRALQAAAILGQRFELDALRHLTGEPDYDCAALLENHLVAPGDSGFLFSHALIRDGVYLSLVQARRRELHAAAADWFAKRDPVTHAEHAGRAGLPEAAAAYLSAARSESEGLRYDRALELIERGLEHASELEIERALTLLKGDLQHYLGDIAGSIATYRTVVETSPDAQSLCDALIGLAGGMRVSDELSEAFEHLDRALEVAQSNELQERLPRIHYLRGALFFPMGRVDDCLDSHRKAVEAARRVGNPAIEVQALGGLADGYYAVGRMIDAHDTYIECVERADENRFVRIAASNRSQIGSLKKFLMEFDDALGIALKAVEEAEGAGDLRACINAHTSSAELHLERGEVEESLPHLDAGEALAERLGAKRFHARILYYRARGLLDRGDRAAALRLLEEAYRIARETGFGYVGPTICASIALASQDAGRRASALEEGERALAEGALFHNAFEFRRDALDLALQEQRWEDAEQQAAKLQEQTVGRLPFVDALADRGRLLASVLSGRGTESACSELAALGERFGYGRASPYLGRIQEALAGAERT